MAPNPGETASSWFSDLSLDGLRLREPAFSAIKACFTARQTQAIGRRKSRQADRSAQDRLAAAFFLGRPRGRMRVRALLSAFR